jgi:hypothetical protein
MNETDVGGGTEGGVGSDEEVLGGEAEGESEDELSRLAPAVVWILIDQPLLVNPRKKTRPRGRVLLFAVGGSGTIPMLRPKR